MKKSVLLFFVSIIVSLNLTQAQINSQNELSKNVVYGSAGFLLVGGNLNANYERIVYRNEQSKFFNTIAFRGTVGIYSFWLDEGINMGATMVGLTGKGNHHLELMLGGNLAYEKRSYEHGVNAAEYYDESLPRRTEYMSMLPALSAGYRFQKPTGGFVFRTGLGFPEGLFIGLGFSF